MNEETDVTCLESCIKGDYEVPVKFDSKLMQKEKYKIATKKKW
jgi:hypothetical protein